MPLYEYKCDKCGHRFERIENHTASEIKKCPVCGGRAERQVSTSAIQFKGSGWYVTDYGGKSTPAAPSEGSSDGGTTKSAEKSDKSSETKSSVDKGSEKRKKK